MKLSIEELKEVVANAKTSLELIELKAERVPVAYTGSGSLAAIKGGHEGYIWGISAEAHPIELYTTPQPAHTEQVIKITQAMLDAAVADYCTTGKYTVENIPYELRRQVEFEAECTFKAMLAAAPKPENKK